ncbi:ATP-dependent helicase [Paenibacillus yonginensis]|uniref:ATP-dependent helicase n=1 Tax=Paenibacillus yonginensis TaxID=1462996 RepID=A0A1B1MX01_9BACL|nr:helicase C-terminal domain-containing protein [Paenibacillus yonginensis]ANS73677.1 ATP-dependent helicase [Paenibacillus yonginensis]
MSYEIAISVRPLVEYVYRSGSITGGFRTNATMQEGTRIHQSIQKTYAETDQKELFLSAEIPYGDLLFKIEGRCDGLIQLDGQWTIDEIKSTAVPLQELEDGLPVHWAQGKMYAYMYAKAEGLASMQVQLTYVRTGSGEQKKLLVSQAFEELEAYAFEVIAAYAPYAEMLRRHEEERNGSIETLPFPFPSYRAGQRKLAGAVYKTIQEGAGLMAKAPTGIGKTMSTLFPAVKAMGAGHIRKIFYLTARTTTRATAEEAFARMQAQGLHLNSVTITAKDKICFKEEEACDAGHCSLCEGYYDRINEAVLDILENETMMTRPVIEAYARKHRVCPFEYSLDIAYAADAVVCDYNYIFDPRVSLKRLFEEQKKQTAVLVDEAHNLVDRGRSMFSAELIKSVFLSIKSEYKAANEGLSRAAGEVNSFLAAVKNNCSSEGRIIQAELPEELITKLEKFVETAELELAANGAGAASQVSLEAQEELLSTYFMAQNFIRMAKLYDDHYLTYAEIIRTEFRIKLFCLDPSELLRQAGKGYRSIIYFSATLSPMSYYRDMLGADQEDYTLSIPSPFRKEQLDVRLVPLSVRYNDRESSKRAIARLLQQVCEERSGGNLLVFFPSYSFMQEVYDTYVQEEGKGVDVVLQQSSMSEEERETFLSGFQPNPERTRLGFAVLGGVFSEGVDLPGDRLGGVIVVGTGLPQIGLENNMLRDYFNQTGRNGFNYAYIFPGMNKVLQAGGRLIRTEQDEGVLVLVDDRFAQEPYRSLLPEEWREYKRVHPASI